MLYEKVFEVEERVGASGEMVLPLNLEELNFSLKNAFDDGFRSIAIVFMHGYRYTDHERKAAELAGKVGFKQISVSHEVSPLMKLLGGGDTTLEHAHLSRILIPSLAQEPSESQTNC